MSFGLINELAQVVNEVDNVPVIGAQHELRAAVLNSLLSERDEQGEIVRKFNPFTDNVDIDEIEGLIDWTAEHLIDFFLKQFEMAKKLGDKNEKRMKALLPSSAGSKT